MLTFLLFATIGLDFNVMSYPSPREVRQAFDDLETLKAKVATLEANQCKCNDKPASSVPQAQPNDSAVTGTDAPRITITESTPTVTGFERVKVCDGNSCRYEWRPMNSGAVQEAYREAQSYEVYEAPKWGLFGRKRARKSGCVNCQ